MTHTTLWDNVRREMHRSGIVSVTCHISDDDEPLESFRRTLAPRVSKKYCDEILELHIRPLLEGYMNGFSQDNWQFLTAMPDDEFKRVEIASKALQKYLESLQAFDGRHLLLFKTAVIRVVGQEIAIGLCLPADSLDGINIGSLNSPRALIGPPQSRDVALRRVMEKLLEIWISYDPDRKITQSRKDMSPYGFAIEMARLFHLSFRAHGELGETSASPDGKPTTREKNYVIESNHTMKTAFGNAMLHLIKDRQSAARASASPARPA